MSAAQTSADAGPAGTGPAGPTLADGIAHPTVFVNDVERARAFYENLGLRVAVRASTGIFMTAGKGTLFALVHRPGATPPAHTVAGFEVQDLGSVVRALRARGVTFEEYDSPGLRTVDGIADMGSYRAAWLRDPDGNFIGVHEPPRPE